MFKLESFSGNYQGLFVLSKKSGPGVLNNLIKISEEWLIISLLIFK